MKTLMSKDHPKYPPYWLWLRENEDEYEEDEGSVFTDVLTCEAGLYLGSRTEVFGPMRLLIDGRSIDCSKKKKGRGISLPRWVEPDSITVKDCDATGILLVEHASMYEALVNAQNVKELSLLLVTGHGVPRLPTRRFLHLLSRERDIPVYVFADNDPWGYFIYSLLKRGTLDPDDHLKYAAIENARFLGLRAGEVLSPEARFKWKPLYQNQINALKSYNCFKSARWQKELDKFIAQKFKTETGVLARTFSATRIVEFLARKLEEKDYLS